MPARSSTPSSSVNSMATPETFSEPVGGKRMLDAPSATQ
jgi:hypothetical protein